MTVKASISLTNEQDAYVRALVANGQYSSVSAVLQHGLELIRRDAERHAVEVEGLRELIRRRREEPTVPLGTKEEFLAAVDAAARGMGFEG